MLKFDDNLFQELISLAAQSARRRSHRNIHTSYQDPVQRLIIAMMPDSYIRPHKHSNPTKFECFIMLKGKLDILIFKENGELAERLNLSAGSDFSGVELPPNTWHSVVCFEPVIFLEVKQGPYEVACDKDFAPWAPEEGDVHTVTCLDSMKTLKIGDYLT